MQEKTKNFDSNITIGNPAKSGNIRKFIDGSVRSSILLRSALIGFGTYQLGWRWSLHAGTQTGKTSENHIGYIISGKMMIQDFNGMKKEVRPGEAFEVGPGNDAWVISEEPCIALDFSPINHDSCP